MEIKELVISKIDSSERYSFSRKVNMITSTELSNELLTANINLENPLYQLESENNITLKDVLQIKVRINTVGVMMLNFIADKLNEQLRQDLVKEISALKAKGEVVEEDQKPKVKAVIEIANKYHPIFISFVNTGSNTLTTNELKDSLNDIEIDFPILLVLAAHDYVDEVDKKKAKKQKAKKEEPKVIVKDDKDVSLKDTLIRDIKSVDYIFFGIFSMFISFGALISSFEAINQEGIAIFLIVLTVAFFGTLTYSTYKTYTDTPTFTYKVKNLLIPSFYMLVGIGLGLGIAFLVSTYLLRVKEGIEMQYALIYGVSTGVSILACAASLALPIPIDIIVKKLAPKFKKKQ